jgi:hypothetical protein
VAKLPKLISQPTSPARASFPPSPFPFPPGTPVATARGAHLAPVWPNPAPSGVLQGPLPPPPETGWPLSFVWICQFSEASRLRKRPGYSPPRGALHPRRHRQAPGLSGLAQAVNRVPWFGCFGLTIPARREMGQMIGTINAQLRTPPVPQGVGGGGVGKGGLGNKKGKVVVFKPMLLLDTLGNDLATHLVWSFRVGEIPGWD